MTLRSGRSFRVRSVARAVLPGAIALALAACGGGGGGENLRPTPPPPPPPPAGYSPSFAPTVGIDAGLVVNPPAIPAQAGPVAFANPSVNQHLILTNAAGALGAGLKGQGVSIGFLDSGVNRNHPTLAGRVARHFINVGSGNDLSVDDKVGHGTVVASLAAGRPAVGNYLNQDGSISGSTAIWGGGVAQDATVLSSRIIGDTRPPDDGSGAGNEIRAGQGYGDFFRQVNTQLADAGARIINNSWGGLYWNDPALTIELATAWKDFVVGRNGIIVFANGNSGRDERYKYQPSDNAMLPTLASDPALERGWLTVGALNPSNPTQLTDYSQQCGPAMNYCLVAPGNAVYIDPKATNEATSGLYQGGGTSYAAPLVSGAAAVVWAAFPYFTNDQVRQAILGGAKDLGAPGVDAVFGWGLLDVTRAANGPSNFAWGDFSVAFSGNSVWRNAITGSGGLVKSGTGILSLAEAGSFAGETRVQAGGLDVRKGLASNVSISSGATLWASGTFGGSVANSGAFLNGASSPATITGNYLQTATGNLGVWLGSKLGVGGTATLAGQMSILGVRSGYTTSAKETLLTANGGISGSFATLRAAPNVFLDASLSYDPNNVFLNINRIDVTQAVAGMGLVGPAMASAARVEQAMQAIDLQLGGASGGGGISGAFVDGAAALQGITSVAVADASLRSLAGSLHGASAELTHGGIDAGRRALDARIDALGPSAQASGGWHRDLSRSGMLAQSGFDRVDLDASGEMIGSDWRIGENVAMGLSTSRVQQSGWLGASGDRARGHQREVQAYAAAWHGPWQAQAQLASGGFDRQLQRNLRLGDLRDAVATQVSGSYDSATLQLGRHVDAGGVRLVPYVGTQYTRVRNDGFAETGQTGFGLRAHAWESTRWQGFAGLRAERGFAVGGLHLRADARAEWQQLLGADGEAFAASFTGLDQFAPLQGMGLSRQQRVLGLGLSTAFARRGQFRFDLGHRATALGDEGTASLQAVLAF